MHNTKIALLINQLPFNLPNLTSVTSAEITELLEFSRAYSIKITNQISQNDSVMHAKVASLFIRVFTKAEISLIRARQEIDNILSQKIDINNRLASHLKITNSMVRMWKKKDAEKYLMKILIESDQS